MASIDSRQGVTVLLSAVNGLGSDLKNCQQEVVTLKSTLEEREKQLIDCEKRCAEYDQSVALLKTELQSKNQLLDTLKLQVQQLRHDLTLERDTREKDRKESSEEKKKGLEELKSLMEQHQEQVMQLLRFPPQVEQQPSRPMTPVSTGKRTTSVGAAISGSSSSKRNQRRNNPPTPGLSSASKSSRVAATAPAQVYQIASPRTTYYSLPPPDSDIKSEPEDDNLPPPVSTPRQLRKVTKRTHDQIEPVQSQSHSRSGAAETNRHRKRGAYEEDAYMYSDPSGTDVAEEESEDELLHGHHHGAQNAKSYNLPQSRVRNGTPSPSKLMHPSPRTPRRTRR